MWTPARTVSVTLLLLILSVPARAEVVRFVVEERHAFASQGIPYEKLTGHFYGHLDPRHPLNAIITDLELAPRNARGLVEYSATFIILKPVDMSQVDGCDRLSGAEPRPADVEGAGVYADFRAAGHTLVASGWQADIAAGARYRDDGDADREERGRLQHHRSGDGAIPRHACRNDDLANHPRPRDWDRDAGEFRYDEGHADPADERGRRPRGHRIRRLGVRRLHAEAVPGSPTRSMCVSRGGFDPAFLYELTYVAKDPPVHGVGFAATRDLIAFLGKTAPTNPLGGTVRHAVAQGTSQSGNYLRSFLSLGFNQDERGQRVFDGMNTNIAARQLSMNIRFAAPSGAAEMFEPGSEGTLWWDDYTDAARGRSSSSLLARCRAASTCPKIVETFGSAEFYSLRMSPDLVGTRADRDIPLPAERTPVLHRRACATAAGRADSSPNATPEPCCVLAGNPNSSAEAESGADERLD